MTVSLHKTLRLGTSQTIGGRYYSIYAKATIQDGKLTISGVEGPLPSGNAIGSCGQLTLNIENLDADWTPGMLSTFTYIWDKWHLNNMRPTCQHQRELGQTYITHPSSICITCGYVLGSAWISEELPETVILFLESLPETNKIPAWI